MNKSVETAQIFVAVGGDDDGDDCDGNGHCLDDDDGNVVMCSLLAHPDT